VDLRRIHDEIRQKVIGREEELSLLLAALGAGRDLLLEGPPGTSKSTLLRAIAEANHTPLHLVEGNADLTPAKLLGHHSPSRVLQEDYSPENFVYGPLPLAMRDGGLLYVEEFNRVPEDTLNTLITAMAERELTVPRVGTIRAAPGFRAVAAMNPFDNIGTGRLSGAVADRLCRVRMGYQSEAEERDIVTRATGSRDPWLIRVAVLATRLTREHPELRMGASVRAAIDLVLVAEQLAQLRGVSLSRAATDEAARRALISAAQTAVSIKMAARESSRRMTDEIVTEVVLAVLRQQPEPEEPEKPPEPAEAEDGSNHAGDRTGGAQPRMGRSGSPPPGATASAGQVYYGDEASRAAARRGGGDRMFRTFSADHPRLVEQLDQKGARLATLEEALNEEPGDPLEVLGELYELYDRSDLRNLARRLAVELLVRTARHDVAGRGGRGRLTSVPFRGSEAELDLERTLEVLFAKPRPGDEDMYVLERRRRRRAYALMLDISGSMKGKAIFHAALALATVAVRVRQDPFAVVAFWREAAILKCRDEALPLDALLDRLLSLSGRGLTDIGLGLRVGLDELEGADVQERIGILFSDGLQTAGEPADLLAAAFPTLHVVATGQSAESIEACRRLAEVGNGRCAAVAQLGGIAEAINACLAA
jgi:MoxR-like ATPase/Mg-chelatase subunit ChlD